MLAQSNCYKFQTNSNESQTTKLHKYLRARNEKMLEKCFNIKVGSSQTLKEVTKIKNVKLSILLNENEKCQQTCENITNQANSEKEENLPKTRFIAVTENVITLKNAKIMKSISIQNMNIRTPKRIATLDWSNKECITSAQCSKHCMNSKSLNSLKTAKSTTLAASRNWKSPFTSATTKGTRLQRRQQSSEFSYDLSRDELKFASDFRTPMKPAPPAERQLLNSGQRKKYLMHRYEHAPVIKYNYPEATSWRIGWLLPKQ